MRKVSDTTLEIRRMAKVLRLRAKIDAVQAAELKSAVKYQQRITKLQGEMDALERGE